MRTVGVRELREKTAQILKEVSQKGETIQVTHHGRVMAQLVPPPKTYSPDDIRHVMERARELMEKIGEHITQPVDSSMLMQEERRWS